MPDRLACDSSSIRPLAAGEMLGHLPSLSKYEIGVNDAVLSEINPATKEGQGIHAATRKGVIRYFDLDEVERYIMSQVSRQYGDGEAACLAQHLAGNSRVLTNDMTFMRNLREEGHERIKHLGPLALDRFHAVVNVMERLVDDKHLTPRQATQAFDLMNEYRNRNLRDDRLDNLP